MKILFLGDIVGKGGRKAVAALVPDLRRQYGCDFCLANGENMAGGGGMTRKCIASLDSAGVDVFTSGDHAWDQRCFADEITELPHVLRPANVNPAQPGRGYGVFNASSGKKVAVVSLLGRVFVNTPANSPFEEADRIVTELSGLHVPIIVDFHAEATSEKIAMAHFLDGRVSAVIGTHTHVATADERILPNGTAFLCDVGMVGALDSVLGRAIEPVVHYFSTGMPARFTVVEKGIRLHGCTVQIDDSGRAVAIERICRDYEPDAPPDMGHTMPHQEPPGKVSAPHRDPSGGGTNGTRSG